MGNTMAVKHSDIKISDCPSGNVIDLKLKKKSRIFVVKDLHGMIGPQYNLIEEFREAVGFRDGKDYLIFDGDSINRGPESRYILELIKDPSYIFLRGNHENEFINNFDENGAWVSKERKEKCEKRGFDWQFELSKREAKRLREAFLNMAFLAIIQIKGKKLVVITHSRIYKNDINKAKEALNRGSKKAKFTSLYPATDFSRTKSLSKVKGAWRVFLGHMPQHKGVRQEANMFFGDTGASFNHTDQGLSDFKCATFIEITAKAEDITKTPSKDALIHIIEDHERKEKLSVGGVLKIA